jgi:hypothetical protein
LNTLCLVISLNHAVTAESLLTLESMKGGTELKQQGLAEVLLSRCLGYVQ